MLKLQKSKNVDEILRIVFLIEDTKIKANKAPFAPVKSQERYFILRALLFKTVKRAVCFANGEGSCYRYEEGNYHNWNQYKSLSQKPGPFQTTQNYYFYTQLFFFWTSPGIESLHAG